MKKIHILDKFQELGISLSNIALGDFDYIGEYTAKKMREQNSPLWKSTGAFFRPNYERGILIYSLIKSFNLQSYLEIGFGRGYSSICAAKALHEIGATGKAVTIDPNFDEQQLKVIGATMPKDWVEKIEFRKGLSTDVVPQVLQETPKFDFVYIDGDHRANAVRRDWEMVKDNWNAFCLFDDYHLPTKQEADIECAKVIDEIDFPNKELIVLDRRIFFDDRRLTDDQIDYGQVLLTNSKLMPDW